ncbi:MAG TPA: protein-L-isoaspartate(D-aspartate) O-methyltransferase [Myxococcota bacterium]|nr:protein-L-isoaspartate(D-aspartate) O-methyltransferase [Myxococcota bacterium]
MSAYGLDAGAPDPTAEARNRMVEEQIEVRGVRDPRVLDAMRQVPRHELVPASQRDLAYEDRPLPIGYGQTISQPYVVAAMTDALHLTGSERVLEIGTGSGYQAAILSKLAKQVYSIEIVPELAQRARADLARLGFANVEVRQGDGWRGWPEQAPFDAIVVTAAPEEVPPDLIAQLAVGGRLVIPVGGREQQLMVVRKTPEGITREVLFGVRFVPMRGEAEKD